MQLYKPRVVVSTTGDTVQGCERSEGTRSLCILLPSTLAHRIAFHLDAMSIMDQAVEDAVGQCGIADGSQDATGYCAAGPTLR